MATVYILNMDFTNDIFIIGFSFGLITVIAGVVTLKFPPKNINHKYGYRTKNSMKSKEAWDFAQVYSAKLMIKGGVLITLIGISGTFMPHYGIAGTGLGAALLVLFCLYLIFKTENKIKQNFSDDK